MRKETKTFSGVTIGVYLEDGVPRRVASNDPSLQGVAVVIIEDDVTTHAVIATADTDGDLARRRPEALNRSRCEGIGIACEVGAERLRILGTTRFTDSNDYLREVAAFVAEFSDLALAAARSFEGEETVAREMLRLGK